MNIKTILKHYLLAALWTSELDGKLNVEDVHEASSANALCDILAFTKKAGNLLDGLEESQVGHDFWLTRNRHGAGFWDRGLGEVGDKLTAICKEFTEVNVFEENGKAIIE